MANLNRGKNVTKEQKEIMVTMMEDNLDLANDRFQGIDGRKTNKECWEEVAKNLNGIGGAFKNPDKWRRAWTDMKKYARTSWSDLKEYDNRTGLGLESCSRRPAELNAMDQRILNIISPESCAGNTNKEGGLPTQTNNEPTTPTSLMESNSPAVTCHIESNTTNTNTYSNVLDTVRATRTKRVRGSAYTRDNLIKEANLIEKNKANYFKRIAEAQERRATAVEKRNEIAEKRNEILEKMLLLKPQNHYENLVQVQMENYDDDEKQEEYLEYY